MMLTGLISCFMLNKMTRHHALKETNILRQAHLDAALHAVGCACHFPDSICNVQFQYFNCAWFCY